MVRDMLGGFEAMGSIFCHCPWDMRPLMMRTELRGRGLRELQRNVEGWTELSRSGRVDAFSSLKRLIFHLSNTNRSDLFYLLNTPGKHSSYCPLLLNGLPASSRPFFSSTFVAIAIWVST